MNKPAQNRVSPPAHDAAWVVDFLAKRGWSYPPKGGNGPIGKALRSVDFVTLLQSAETIKAQGAIVCVIELYKHWIDVNSGSSPHIFAAWFNLGVELSAAGDVPGATICYRNALAIKADFYQAAINLGLVNEAQGQLDAALEIWRNATQPDDARTTLLNHQGRVLEDRKQFKVAEEKLWASLLTDPHQAGAVQHWVHLRQKMCKWPVFGNGIPGLTQDQIIDYVGPLSSLALFDDLKIQDRIVERFLESKVPPVAGGRLSPVNGYNHDKIRVGYLSSDYCMHPMSYLVSELFERHDRSRFEIYGYCNSPEDNSDVRRRVISAFDTFTVVKTMTDEQAAHLIRSHEIDILIDLNGPTTGTRMQILRWKPAPVQATWLGYIGSIPMAELDYTICDEYVVPRHLAETYQPKPLYMPDCYQVNDSKLAVGPKVTRAEVGLPEDKFVFCCFSNNYKNTEMVFDAWMEILKRTENSVFWLLADNPWQHDNFTACAVAHGVDPSRLIFAPRVDPPQYLARLETADLFLDTYPYNAGTTASDALRMGLPIVTLSGECFAARMAGSLLHAMGQEMGITTTIEDYIEVAVQLASDPAKYGEYRQSLAGDTWRRTIGNIEAFTANLEAAYQSILIKP